ncbi:hypothetical protein [Burkholderia ambifaria]|uniref:hypothetical protein n=1 Tax=Burkholderia ambifaria TaxID=152480 RepID=UPI00158EA8A2|nr:hypothetical protein [Burkholderia ambifaria]
MRTVNRRQVLGMMAATIAAPLFTSCGGGGDDQASAASGPNLAPPPSSPNSRLLDVSGFEVFPDNRDPKILGRRLEDKTCYLITGEKDSTGSVTGLSGIEFYGGGQPAIAIDIDATTGVVSVLDGGAKTGISVDPDGSVAMNFFIMDVELPVSIPASVFAPAVFTNTASGNTDLVAKKADRAVRNAACSSCSSVKVSPTDAWVGAPIVQTTVTGCRSEIRRVKIIVADRDGNILNEFPAYPDENGVYNTVIPYLNTNDTAWAEAAQRAIDFFEAIDLTSGAFSAVYKYLSDSDATTTSLEFLADFLSTSIQRLEGQEELAFYFGNSLTVEEYARGLARAQTLAKLGTTLKFALKGLAIYGELRNAFLGGLAIGSLVRAAWDQVRAVRVQAVVETINGAVGKSALIEVQDISRGFPPLQVAVPQSPSNAGTSTIFPLGILPDSNLSRCGPQSQDTGCVNLPVGPTAPLSTGRFRDGYSWAAGVDCPQAGDTLVATTTGSDGYSDRMVDVIAQTGGSLSFGFRAPGGASTGTIDRIRVEVQRNGETIASRRASVVFT